MKVPSTQRSVRGVLVLGATFATDNMGVSALASGAISIVSRRFPDAQISFLDYAREPTHTSVLIEGRAIEVPLINLRFSWRVWLQNNVAYLLVLTGLSRLLGERFARRIGAGNPWLRAVREADLAVAVSGGDSFSDIYGLGRFFYVYLPQLLVLWAGTRLVLLPQTVGPFRTRLARWLAKWLLGRALRICTREQSGVIEVRQLLGDIGTRARFCYDMGFVLEPRRPNRGLEVIETLRHSGRPLVALNVSGLLMMGGYDRSNAFQLKVDYGDLMQRTIDFLIERRDVDVVLVPHVFGEQAESDSIACVNLHTLLAQRYQGRLACVNGRFDQNEVKYLIGQTDLLVGGRMHACIAALSQGVPAVGIAYSQKFLGVFQTIGAGDLVADPRSMTAEQILDTIDNVLRRRGEVAAKLRSAMVEVKRDLFSALDGIE
jgi:polysaccharide pyruvyl transferase WcaK-like protein